MKFRVLIFLFSISCSSAQNISSTKKAHPEIWVRNGFILEIVLEEVKNPRFLQLDREGTLYISQPSKGVITSCKDRDNDGYYETLETYVENHKSVHGMHWKDGWLWFAETGAIFKSRDTNNDGIADEVVEIIKKGEIPSKGGHWWRPVLIHKDRIYTAIGCSGNITDETDSERLKIWSFNLEGKDKQFYAGGLRNTEKLVIRPNTDEIWGMDHGSDWFGLEMEKKEKQGQPITDFNPPCEMNHYKQGEFYGHPYITGNKVPRYEYMNRKDIVEWAKKTTVPEWITGAHWAPNAMTFYNGKQFPTEYVGDAFVAYHGSWNRSTKGGYSLSRVLFENGKPFGEKQIIRFLNESEEILGRPVDVIQTNDGSLLISDDWGSKVYKLSYKAGFQKKNR